VSFIGYFFFDIKISAMKYIDIYKQCVGCPVSPYCGTVISSIKLCNSLTSVEDIEDNLINLNDIV
jgi:hypothetical protein